MTFGKQQIRILLVEDAPADAHVLAQVLAKESPQFELTHADRLSIALQFLDQGRFDLVLLDLMLPESKGLHTLSEVRERAPQLPIIVLTASNDEELALQALQQGAQDYLVKAHLQTSRHLLARSIRYAIERKRTEEELRHAHAQTERVLASLTSVLIGIGPGGLVTHWNAVAREMFGLAQDDVVGRPLAECRLRLDTGPLLAGIASCRATGEPVRLHDIPFQRPNGQLGYLGITIIPVRESKDRSEVLVYGADVSQQRQAEAERSRLQEQLAQSQKMEVIGRFAGGIAHDFHNFLAVMRGFAELIGDQHQDDPDTVENVSEILRAADSGLALINQILAFSRRQVFKPEVFELSQAVRKMERFLRQLLGEPIQIQFQLLDRPLMVSMDRTSLEQVIINFSTNARDVMREGGTLTIATQDVAADAAFRSTRAWAVRDRYIRLTVRDTGSGMDPETARRIFEPFFTTKERGRGTGLGLAVVCGLIEQHEGAIEVDTAPGCGTAFHVYIPRVQVQAPIDAPVAEPAPSKPARPRVLVVDDEMSMRSLCAKILQTACEVTSVDSAAQALESLRRGAFDVMVTDVVMPEMDGFRLLEEVAKLTPRPRVVAMSGFLDEEMERRLRESVVRPIVIRKPLVADDLRALVRRAIAG